MKQLLIFLLLSITFLSCGSDDLPECIDAILDDFRVTACPGQGELTTWRFRGGLVYCFDWGACLPEQFVEIYDAECNLICELGGPDFIDVCAGSEWASAEFRAVEFRQ